MWADLHNCLQLGRASLIQTVCTEKRTARAMHRCDSCDRSILIKEEYWRFFIVDNRKGYTWKEHASCRKAAQIIWDSWSHWQDEFPVISEVDDEDVASVVTQNRVLALLVFGSTRVRKAEEIATRWKKS